MPTRARLFLLLWPLAPAALGQVRVQGRVVDAGTHAPLPYASITGGHADATAITNEEGVFRIDVDGPGDSLTISYLGYHRVRVAASAAREVALRPSTTELHPVEVKGGIDPAYDLVVRCARRLDRSGRYRAKLYYELGTSTEGRPVEALECFYNAELKGPAIETLALKNGRIAVVPDKGRYTMNLNTSKGFTLLRPTRSGPFPLSPLELGSARALHKRYDLTVLGITYDPQELQHILLVPRDTTNAFRAELWIAPQGEIVHSLELTCTDCGSHPFQALYPSAELRGMDIRYRQTYAPVGGRYRLSTVELDYAVTYHPRLAAPDAELQRDKRIHAKGVMHLFDHGRGFILPLFEYDQEQTDYRKITFMPYDSLFWATAPTLVRTGRQEREMELFLREGTLLGHGRKLDPAFRSTLFQSNYAFWSPTTRITMRSNMAAGAAEPRPRSTAAPAATQVDLVAQLFLNIDSTATGLRTFSTTVFDGFRSYRHLPPGPYTDLFLNLFFDLCEIERRRMQAKLDVPGLTLERARSIHREAEEAMHHITYRYMAEVRYGEDAAALRRWSDRVRDALGIDNFALFPQQE